MAAQLQQPPANLGVPGLALHFWDSSTSSYAKIAIIYDKGSQYPYEDVVWHAWGEICDLYFPKIAATPTGPRWCVDREAYRGLLPYAPSEIKPDLIAIKLTSGPTQPGQIPQFNSRDYLWIECKATSEDSPSGWKKVLSEAVHRLSRAHPNRAVFLIIAIGWKCMYFIWNPTSQTTQPQLFINRFDRTGYWDIDIRIMPLQSAAWVDATTGEISCQNALELECWTRIPGQTALQNGHALGMIEQFLVGVQNTALQGLNPYTF